MSLTRARQARLPSPWQGEGSGSGEGEKEKLKGRGASYAKLSLPGEDQGEDPISHALYIPISA